MEWTGVPQAPSYGRTTDVTIDDGAARAAYLQDVVKALYPQPADGPGERSEFLVVPHARAPRLLVPARPRRVAAAAVRRYAEPRNRVAKLKRQAVVLALRTGTHRWLLPDRVRVATTDSIESHLRRVLDEPVIPSIHIGPARANRKAVVQLLRPDGRTVGFAKVSTGALTQRLVREETVALQSLADADLRLVTVPQVWYAGNWAGHEILVQRALPVWAPRAALSPGRLAAAMRELAECTQVTEGPLGDSSYLAQLQQRVAAVADHPDGAQLAEALDRLTTVFGDLVLRYGSWHGDWTPWNMAVLEDTLLVWDWERFSTGVPIGFDAVHYALQSRAQVAADPAQALATTLREVPDLLAPFDVDAAAREPTALLYLADLAARYLADRQAEAGARLGALGTWLLPGLLGRLDHLG